MLGKVILSSVPKRIPRINESVEVKRRRLLYQSRKRGILEADLLFSTFADLHLSKLTDLQLDMYDRLLDENDWDLYYWASGEKIIPTELLNNDVLNMCKEHFKNERKALIRMPSLSSS